MSSLRSHASGIIISTACAMLRPPGAAVPEPRRSARCPRPPGRTDREDLVQVVVVAEHVGVDQRFPRPHPVLVARDGVDLAVVRHAAERMRQRPRRERVGGEPRVHDTQRAGQPLILKIQVERPQLGRGEHALVDQGLAGKTWEVHGLTAGAVLPGGALGAQFVLGALADHEGAPFQVHAGGAADEHLAQRRHGVAGQGAQRGIVGRDIPPASRVRPSASMIFSTASQASLASRADCGRKRCP